MTMLLNCELCMMSDWHFHAYAYELGTAISDVDLYRADVSVENNSTYYS